MTWFYLILGLIIACMTIIWGLYQLIDLARIQQQIEEDSLAFHRIADPVMEYLNEGNPWDEATWQEWNRQRSRITLRHRMIGCGLVALLFVVLLVLPEKKEETS